MKKFFLLAALLVGCGPDWYDRTKQFVDPLPEAHADRGGRERAFARRPRGGSKALSVDLPNTCEVGLNGSTAYFHINPHVSQLDITDDMFVFTRFTCASQTGGRVLYSKDNGSTQRTVMVDLQSCNSGVCALRAVECQTLSACGQTRTTNTGSFLNGDDASAGIYLDHPNALLVPYVNGAANLVANAGSVPTTPPTASTSRHTFGAHDGGAGTTEIDCDFDDSFVIITPRMSDGSKPTVNQISTCMYDLHNDRGSRKWPSSCPSYAATIAAGGRMSGCRGGDDNACTGSTCSNWFNPGTDDWTLVNASFQASTITKLPASPTVIGNNAVEQVGLCFPAQSNCGSTANVLADLDSPTPGQADNYPRFVTRGKIYLNDGFRQFATATPQPIDRSTALVPTFVRINDVGTAWQDDTADCTNATTGDCSLIPATEATGDYIAFAYSNDLRFDRLIFDRTGGTQGVGGTCAWEYCSANSDVGTACDTWTAVSGLSDATTCMTAALGNSQVVSWTHPSNWVLATEDSVQDYFIRMRVTGVYSTNPVASQVRFPAQADVWPVSADGTFRVSPLVALCDDLLNRSGWASHNCGVIPTSRGGSAMSGLATTNNWMPQLGGQTSGLRLFGEGINRTAAAQIDSNATIAWVMAWQGESQINEANPTGTFPTDWHAWNHRYQMLAAIEGARDQFVANGITDGRTIPWCIVKLPPSPPNGSYNATRWQMVRDGIDWIASQTNDVFVFEMPDGYAISGDEVHQSSAGVDVAGRGCAALLGGSRRLSLVN